MAWAITMLSYRRIAHAISTLLRCTAACGALHTLRFTKKKNIARCASANIARGQKRLASWHRHGVKISNLPRRQTSAWAAAALIAGQAALSAFHAIASTGRQRQQLRINRQQTPAECWQHKPHRGQDQEDGKNQSRRAVINSKHEVGMSAWRMGRGCCISAARAAAYNICSPPSRRACASRILFCPFRRAALFALP